MSEKKASVHWEGAGKAGQGQISTETGALDRYPYGFASRFGDDRKGTSCASSVISGTAASAFDKGQWALASAASCRSLHPPSSHLPQPLRAWA